MKLSRKIYNPVLFAFGALFVLTTLFLVFDVAPDLERQAVAQHQLVADILSNQMEGLQPDTGRISRTFDPLVQKGGFDFWWLTDGSGRIVAADEPLRKGENAWDYLPEAGRLDLSIPQVIEIGNNRKAFLEPTEFTDQRGTLILGLTLNQFQQQAYRTSLVLAGQALIVLALLYLFLHRVIGTYLRPVTLLKEAAEAVGRGDLALQIDIQSNDELADLSVCFKQMITSLKETTVSKRYVESLVAGMATPLLVFNADGGIEMANPSACAMLEYEHSDLVQRTWKEIFSPANDFSRHTDHDQHFESHWCTADGSLIPVLASIGTIPRSRGPNQYVCTVREIAERKRVEEEREMLIAELQQALNEIKTLSGLLPICSKCKKIRDDQGYWTRLEEFFRHHSYVQFSHGLCPECVGEFYHDNPDLFPDDDPGSTQAQGSDDPTPRRK